VMKRSGKRDESLAHLCDVDLPCDHVAHTTVVDLNGKVAALIEPISTIKDNGGSRSVRDQSAKAMRAQERDRTAGRRCQAGWVSPGRQRAVSEVSPLPACPAMRSDSISMNRLASSTRMCQ
jgi:hypothetical protein